MATSKASARSQILQRRETLVSYLFLLPALFFFVGFVLTPMLMGLITSFTDSSFANAATGSKFVFLDNYIRLFKDPIFRKSAWNTLVIVVVSVPTVTAFSLWVGSAIYKMKSGVRSFFRCVFYLPVVTGSVAVVVVWKWMFDKYNGLFNYVIRAFGGEGLPWTESQTMALWCIILILFTTSIGQPIVLYVSALGNVDSSLVEAAQVDGATDLQVFWKIKWPSIMPTTLYVAGHHHHQQLPVLRPDPAADLRRPQLQYQYHHVLPIRDRVPDHQGVRLRRRHGCHSGHWSSPCSAPCSSRS